MRKILEKLRGFKRRFYRVPYCVPVWGWAEHWAMIRCLFAGHVITGPDKERLYALVREKTGMEYVFGYNSGREAITAALKARGVTKGDKVIMPSYCCETVAKAVMDTGAQPHFCDIDENFNPNVKHIMSILDDTVRGIIFPHLFGTPGPIDKLERELEKKGLREKIFLIDDAAQSFGARLNDRLIGTFADAGIISFGPGKTMTATGGGLVVTNSAKLAGKLIDLDSWNVNFKDKFKILNYWLIFRRWRRFTLPFLPYLRFLFKQNVSDGNRLKKICNLDAAIAICQMKRLREMLEVRMRRKKKLDELLSHLFPEMLYMPPANELHSNDQLNVATKYIVHTKNSSSRDDDNTRYNDFMHSQSIELQDLYIPIHHNPVFRVDKATLPNTELYSKRVLQVPLEPSLNAKEFDFTIEKTKEILRYLTKSHASS